jgi:competence protein ComEA
VSSEEKPPPRAVRRRLGVGAAIVVVIVALALTVGIGILRGATAPTSTVAIDGAAPGEATPTPSASLVYVHVAGAVREGGLYALPAGARVLDAVSAAGGFAADAGRDAVNLARPVADGEQIVVPVAGAAPTPGPSTAASGGPGGDRIDLNTADVDALDTLPRIGPAMAKRIIDWRTANGRFTSIDDLLAVPGIGDKMLESLRDLVRV